MGLSKKQRNFLRNLHDGWFFYASGVDPDRKRTYGGSPSENDPRAWVRSESVASRTIPDVSVRETGGCWGDRWAVHGSTIYSLKKRGLVWWSRDSRGLVYYHLTSYGYEVAEALSRKHGWDEDEDE